MPKITQKNRKWNVVFDLSDNAEKRPNKKPLTKLEVETLCKKLLNYDVVDMPEGITVTNVGAMTAVDPKDDPRGL